MTLCALPGSVVSPVTPIVAPAKLLIKCTRLPADAAGVDCADNVKFVQLRFDIVSTLDALLISKLRPLKLALSTNAMA